MSGTKSKSDPEEPLCIYADIITIAELPEP